MKEGDYISLRPACPGAFCRHSSGHSSLSPDGAAREKAAVRQLNGSPDRHVEGRIPQDSSSVRGTAVAELLDCSPSTKMEPGSILSWVTSRFLQVGIVPYDAASWRPFDSGAAPFSPRFTSSTLKNSLRAPKISQLNTAFFCQIQFQQLFCLQQTSWSTLWGEILHAKINPTCICKAGLPSHSGIYRNTLAIAEVQKSAKLPEDEQQHGVMDKPRQGIILVLTRALAERLDCSPPTNVIRVHSPASQVFASGTMPGDAAGRLVFLRISRFPHPCIPVVEDGYEFFAKRQLVTLFSAPNYCGEFDNAGAMMSVDETLMCSFQILKISNALANSMASVTVSFEQTMCYINGNDGLTKVTHEGRCQAVGIPSLQRQSCTSILLISTTVVLSLATSDEQNNSVGKSGYGRVQWASQLNLKTVIKAGHVRLSNGDRASTHLQPHALCLYFQPDFARSHHVITPSRRNTALLRRAHWRDSAQFKLRTAVGSGSIHERLRTDVSTPHTERQFR
ncbi:hypothetical protein PR048_013693 [Dryococelus australis]|uniref:protein-serine/threonine phosphatase n=1 Tax=Dryococelus australis TaxID=614101 RepID=A0ABQ9HSW6_9NEOP|nr:hypothetical protein PR048_013693 [Dryococelus australis]